MLTGLIIGFVAGQIVGIVAAAFLSAARGADDDEPGFGPTGPRRSRGIRFILSKRGGIARRSSGRSRVVA